MVSFPVQYQNGPFKVTIQKDGLKVREGKGQAPWPEHMDIKITDWCNAGCAFCHEDSTVRGLHAPLEPLKEFLSAFPYGTELALGGGHPLVWPHLYSLLTWARDKFICNITINGIHVPKGLSTLQDLQTKNLIHGIGISAITDGIEYKHFYYHGGLENVVGHIILGRQDWYRLRQTIEETRRTKRFSYHQYRTYDNVCDKLNDRRLLPHYLILGYKEYGRGIQYLRNQPDYKSIETNRANFKKHLPFLLMWFQENNIKISFDNLAIEQLDLKNLLAPELWDRLYMGTEGQFGMYVDAVKQELALSSYTAERKSWKDPQSFFQSLTSK